MGNVSDETAHPFNTPHVIGVHNGTLSHGWEDRLGAGKDVSVDSEALMRCISTRGAKHAIKNAEGAMAIIFYSFQQEKLFMFRNDERPLSYAITQAGTLLLASEKGMLEWLMTRCKLNLKRGTNIESVPTDILYDITDGELKEVDVIEDSGTWGSYTSASYMGSRLGRNNYSSSSNLPSTTNVCKKMQCTVCGADIHTMSDEYLSLGAGGEYMCADKYCVEWFQAEMAESIEQGTGKVALACTAHVRYNTKIDNIKFLHDAFSTVHVRNLYTGKGIESLNNVKVIGQS